MIATPICYDQFANADEIERLGIGKSIKFTDITEKNLSEALTDVCYKFLDTTTLPLDVYKSRLPSIISDDEIFSQPE